jgi:glucose/arabinose dehydrogenase
MINILVLLSLLQVSEQTSSIPDVQLVPALPGHTYREPVQVLPMPGNELDLVIVERSGRVVMTALGGGEDRILLDLRTKVSTRNSEEGLLSVAFHPSWPDVPELFVYRSLNKPRRTVLSRFTGSSDGIDPAIEEVILEVKQPWGNHNGGTVLFGPDGHLYLSIGDGGSAADPDGNGQNMSTLLGKIIRIDPSRKTESLAYTIPSTNPFVHKESICPEIWASGLRNVWRMSFDSKTGELWAGDVGQNAWEEIDIIVRGGNYGWNIREGNHAFNDEDATKSDLIEPIIEYGRRMGGSVTGGSVYRGKKHPSLDGVYVYGDYMSGRLWGACRGEDGVLTTRELTGEKRLFPSSFGTGPHGELYACIFEAPYQRSGKIMRIEAR